MHGGATTRVSRNDAWRGKIAARISAGDSLKKAVLASGDDAVTRDA
jgi:hypothetical protein